MAPSLDGKPIDTKEAQSVHEVQLSLVDTNPVYFLVLGIIFVYVVLAYQIVSNLAVFLSCPRVTIR